MITHATSFDIFDQGFRLYFYHINSCISVINNSSSLILINKSKNVRLQSSSFQLDSVLKSHIIPQRGNFLLDFIELSFWNFFEKIKIGRIHLTPLIRCILLTANIFHDFPSGPASAAEVKVEAGEDKDRQTDHSSDHSRHHNHNYFWNLVGWLRNQIDHYIDDEDNDSNDVEMWRHKRLWLYAWNITWLLSNDCMIVCIVFWQFKDIRGRWVLWWYTKPYLMI